MVTRMCDCHACESGDPSMCYGCPAHGAWCDWFREGPQCAADNRKAQVTTMNCWFCPTPAQSDDRLCPEHRALVDSMPVPHAFIDLTLADPEPDQPNGGKYARLTRRGPIPPATHTGRSA